MKNKFFACLAFFTRLPAASHGTVPLADALIALPLVGLIIGLLGVLVALLGGGLPPEAQALVALIVMILATGALHEDGLADCADGFGGGATKDRKLEIMRDSRIGTYGVLALLLVVTLEFMLISVELRTSPWTLLSLAVVARAAIPVAMWAGRPAREDGLGAATGKPSQQVLFFNLGAAIVLGLIFGGLPALICALLFGTAAYWLAMRQIGGLTGDVYGLLVKATGVGFLLGAVAS